MIYDHSRCPAATHDRDTGTAIEDGQPVDDHGMLLCRDCLAPLIYCSIYHDYDHAVVDAPRCALVRSAKH